MREAMNSSMAGHSRADYMTERGMQGDIAGALDAAVTPPAMDCVRAPRPSRPNYGEMITPAEPVTQSPSRPRYHPEIEELLNFFPEDCGYAYTNVPRPVTRLNCQILSSIIDGGSIDHCNSSQCQFAGIMGLVLKLRDTPRWPSIKDDFRCNGKAYNIFNGYDNVLTIAEEYNLGEATRKRVSQIDRIHAETGKPAPGDLMLFQRNDSAYIPRSAHSGFFSHYKKDEAGKISDVCYWSSFKSLNGYGLKCESVSVLNFIDSVTLDGA